MRTVTSSYPDVLSGEITTLYGTNALHLYAGENIHHFNVPDSRAGCG